MIKHVDITILVAPHILKPQVAPATTILFYTWGTEVQRKLSQDATVTKQQSLDSRSSFYFQIYIIANTTSLNHLMKTLCQSTFLKIDSDGNFKHGDLSIHLFIYLPIYKAANF